MSDLVEICANGDRVFVWVHFTGHGADSGVAMEMELAHVVTVEDGRTRRMQEDLARETQTNAPPQKRVARRQQPWRQRDRHQTRRLQ